MATCVSQVMTFLIDSSSKMSNRKSHCLQSKLQKMCVTFWKAGWSKMDQYRSMNFELFELLQISNRSKFSKEERIAKKKKNEHRWVYSPRLSWFSFDLYPDFSRRRARCEKSTDRRGKIAAYTGVQRLAYPYLCRFLLSSRSQTARDMNTRMHQCITSTSCFPDNNLAR